METTLLLALLKYVVPIIIELAKKWGFTDFAESLAAKSLDDIALAIKETKTYQSYPSENTKGQATFTD